MDLELTYSPDADGQKKASIPARTKEWALSFIAEESAKGPSEIAAVVQAGHDQILDTIDIGTSGQSAAAEAEEHDRERVQPTLVAVAIGQLDEADSDMSTTVSLQASIREGQAGGNLRFFCDDVGYYNGSVQTLSVEDGIITVTGAGGLFRPDGTRINVHYSVEFSTETNMATISVEGRDYEYTITGELDGLVVVKEPSTLE